MTSFTNSKQPGTRAFVAAIAAFTLFTATLGALFIHSDRSWIAFAFICMIPVVIGALNAAFQRLIARTS